MSNQLERAYRQLDDLVEALRKAQYPHADTKTHDCLMNKFNECSVIVKQYARIYLWRFMWSSLLMAFNVYSIGLGCRVLLHEKCYVLGLSTMFNLIVALMLGRIAYLSWYLYRHTKENCKYIEQLKISFNYGDHKRTG